MVRERVLTLSLQILVHGPEAESYGSKAWRQSERGEDPTKDTVTHSMNFACCRIFCLYSDK